MSHTLAKSGKGQAMSEQAVADTPKKSRFPDSMVLIFGMIFVAQLLTYIIPSGEFDRAAKVEGGSIAMSARIWSI